MVKTTIFPVDVLRVGGTGPRYSSIRAAFIFLTKRYGHCRWTAVAKEKGMLC